MKRRRREFYRSALELTRTYVSRIIEYHIKDTAPEHKGGFKGTLTEPYNTRPDNRIFFELGKGGVDFPAIKTLLDDHAWKGWWTVAQWPMPGTMNSRTEPVAFDAPPSAFSTLL